MIIHFVAYIEKFRWSSTKRTTYLIMFKMSWGIIFQIIRQILCYSVNLKKFDQSYCSENSGVRAKVKRVVVGNSLPNRMLFELEGHFFQSNPSKDIFHMF